MAAIGRSPRLDDVVTAVRKLADARLCSVVPMQYAIAPALAGDRSHQLSFRKELQARADLTVSRLCAMPGVSCVAPTAAFYAMPQVTLPKGKACCVSTARVSVCPQIRVSCASCFSRRCRN